MRTGYLIACPTKHSEMSRGEAMLVFNTLTACRERTDEKKNQEAIKLAGNYLKQRGIIATGTLEEMITVVATKVMA